MSRGGHIDRRLLFTGRPSVHVYAELDPCLWSTIPAHGRQDTVYIDGTPYQVSTAPGHPRKWLFVCPVCGRLMRRLVDRTTPDAADGTSANDRAPGWRWTCRACSGIRFAARPSMADALRSLARALG